MNLAAARYTRELEGLVRVPIIKSGSFSSWAQYSILLENQQIRDSLQEYLKRQGIPTMVYYPKPMSRQTAFQGMDCVKTDLSVSESLCRRVLALPLHPYISEDEQACIVEKIKNYVG